MKAVWLIIALCLTPLAQAAPFSLAPYQHARVVFQSAGATDDYLFALGSYKKISGNWRLDRQERLTGHLSRFTVELPAGHEANQGFDFYREQLNAFKVRELFHCSGRDCGTSNSWANNHFNILLLYGLDQFQQYGAYEVISAEGAAPVYVALYSVQRGNKRVYVQVDVLQSQGASERAIAANPESIIRTLEKEGYYVFPVSPTGGFAANLSAGSPHLQVLVEVMQHRADWTFALVGHDYAPTSLSGQQKNAQAYADQLKAALEKAGIRADRLLSYGLGGLAPAGRGDSTGRVEIVKISR